MNKYNPIGMSKEEWIMSTPTIIDYHHRSQAESGTPANQSPPGWKPPASSVKKDNFDEMVQLQLQMLNKNQSSSTRPFGNVTERSTPQKPFPSQSRSQRGFGFQSYYDPFVEDMDISDDENQSQAQSTPKRTLTLGEECSKTAERSSTVLLETNMEVTSGAAFYKGLILFIPPFEQLAVTNRTSPAMKMLYASFEFSFKMSIRIESRTKENDPNTKETLVYFRDNIIATGSGAAPHVEASVRALELLSETCYTIQAKEDYFIKCKLVNGENMKTLNLKKWEAVSEKYPKLLDITKESHIQKTFAVFLDSHTSSGVYDDIVLCNLTRPDVNNIKKVVEFFNLTMLPCSVSTNLSKKATPCVVSIQKYTSAHKLLDLLIECGGENENFKLHPPDTFKDFYKLSQKYWDPNTKDHEKKDGVNTTLEDEDMQALILKPYENIIAELFEKHKSLPKPKTSKENIPLRKVGDDFMRETLKIDVQKSKSVAPVERMQLLLKYMEQLQEYGSRVLTSGRPEMIGIYHNAISNLREDLETCRKDIEKDQKAKTSGKTSEKTRSNLSRSPTRRRRSRSPVKKGSQRNRSSSPKKRTKSRSPKRLSRPGRKSPSPHSRLRLRTNERKSRSPTRRGGLSPSRKSRSPSRRGAQLASTRRSRSPLRRGGRSPPSTKLRSPVRRGPQSPTRISRSPLRRGAQSPTRKSRSPPKWLGARERSPRPARNVKPSSEEDGVFATIFKDQFRRYIEILRRFRIEVEDTPIERRSILKERLMKHKEQLKKFRDQILDNPAFNEYMEEVDLCRDEINEQSDLVDGKPGPNDLPRNITPPPWLDGQNPFVSTAYPIRPGFVAPVTYPIMRPPMMRTPQLRAPQIMPQQLRPTLMRPTQMRPTQIRPTQMGPPQMGPPQMGLKGIGGFRY